MIVDFTKQVDGLVVLVIEALDKVVKIIQFSDRPYPIVLYCIVKMITSKQLQDMWGEGKNSFKADPPNAVLSASGFDTTIVILEAMTVTDGKLTYLLVLTDPSHKAVLQGGQLKDVVLTIDGCHASFWTSKICA